MLSTTSEVDLRNRNLLHLATASLWAFWPFLPLVRRTEGQEEEFGVLCDLTGQLRLRREYETPTRSPEIAAGLLRDLVSEILAESGVDARLVLGIGLVMPGPFGVEQSYLLFARVMDELVQAADLGGVDGRKAPFVVKAVVDALAPTNTLMGNPTALRRAFDTGGRSVLAGLRIFLDDVVSNGGVPRQVDTSPFEVGRPVVRLST